MPRRLLSASVALASLTLFAVAASAAPPSEKTVWLSSLDLTRMTAGWGQPRADKNIENKPLAIAGKTFEHGVGTHADSTLYVELPAGAQRFLAQVGLDDSSLRGKQAGGTVGFHLLADGREVFSSGLMKAGDAPKPVDVDLTGVKTLVLLVDAADDGIDFDHADWADARFLVPNATALPRAVAAPREEPVILTPKPPATPRINGARIFGARPGRPFLFTIPATGQRPLRFAADNLPPGLALDAATGRISGSVAAPGTYAVTLRAKNALGAAERPLKIVIGDTLALTPHMGWNSWYVWENRVTDQIIRDAADAMVSSGMIDHGYMYINIDDCWAVRPDSKNPELGGEPRDPQGRLNSNRRFPDMKALADYIHARGLKAGLYTSPGPLTCARHAGSFQHEAQDAQTFAEWGYDFLKYDWCSYGQVAGGKDLPHLKKPYEVMWAELQKQNRDIVFNLCQYGMGDVWQWGASVGHSWRTSGDLGLTFEGIPAGIFRDGFDLYSRRELHKFARPGAWNDPDYLLLGHLSNWRGSTAPTPLSPNEQYTHVTLWCIVAAPLIFSGDITRLDDFTLNLLCNDEVLDVDQDPLGRPGRRIAAAGRLEVWAKDLEDGSKAVALFNRGEFAAPVTARWTDLGLAGKQTLRDLWRQKDLGTFEQQFTTEVPRHGTVLLRMTPAR